MKAIAVRPGVAGSLGLEQTDLPPGPEGGLLVRTLAVGVCGTDMEIIAGAHGEAPPSRDRLIIGHESLGVVEQAPDGSAFSVGDHVAGIVRRPDPVPCSCCARGAWDMCLNGLYLERGIKGLDGFAAESFRVEPEYAVKVDPDLAITGVLVEPASVVAKAWRRVDSVAALNCQTPQTALVTGAGPIGLLAALLAIQRGLEVHVLDRVTSGPKPRLVEQAGATYHTGSLEKACKEPGITVECTGVGELALAAIRNSGRNGIVCLTGVSEGGKRISVDAGGLNRDLVLENDVVFGSVNANRDDYEAAVRALSAADPSWLSGVITRRVPLESWQEAYSRRDGDVKTVITFDGSG